MEANPSYLAPTRAEAGPSSPAFVRSEAGSCPAVARGGWLSSPAPYDSGHATSAAECYPVQPSLLRRSRAHEWMEIRRENILDP
jgi:hypothetical protein